MELNPTNPSTSLFINNQPVNPISVEGKVKELMADFLKVSIDQVSLEYLKGGCNHKDFKALCLGQNYFVKYSSKHGDIVGSSQIVENECQQIAHKYGLSPQVLYYLKEDGLYVTEFIENVESEFEIKSHEDKVKLVEMLRTVHQIKEPFSEKFCPFEKLDHYLVEIEKLGILLPDVIYSDVIPQVELMRNEKLFLNYVPCHQDPRFANILDDGNKLHLIDWEFAAMSDPFFDLATMASSEELTDEEMYEILTLYLERDPSVEDKNRLSKLRILADLRWSLVCFIFTKVNDKTDYDFDEYADCFLEQVLQRLSQLKNAPQ